VLPDVIASTIGNAVASKIQDSIAARGNGSGTSASDVGELRLKAPRGGNYRIDDQSLDLGDYGDVYGWSGSDSGGAGGGTSSSWQGSGGLPGGPAGGYASLVQAGTIPDIPLTGNVVDPVVITASPGVTLDSVVASIEASGQNISLKAPAAWSAQPGGSQAVFASMAQYAYFQRRKEAFS